MKADRAFSIGASTCIGTNAYQCSSVQLCMSHLLRSQLLLFFIAQDEESAEFRSKIGGGEP